MDDFMRFATAVHFETEKGDKFNKFIRDHVQYTNRQLPPPDVLQPFGQQFMFRHIVDGGFWETSSSERVSAGSGIHRVPGKKS